MWRCHVPGNGVTPSGRSGTLISLAPDPETAARGRLPRWSGDFARQALANAVGTLIAGLVVLLGGVLIGAFSDVSTKTVLIATAALVFALWVTIAVATGPPLQPMDMGMRSWERTDVSDLFGVTGMAHEAREALASGDVDKARRLADQMERIIAHDRARAVEVRRLVDDAQGDRKSEAP